MFMTFYAQFIASLSHKLANMVYFKTLYIRLTCWRSLILAVSQINALYKYFLYLKGATLKGKIEHINFLIGFAL